MQTNNSEIRNSPSVKKHQKGRPVFRSFGPQSHLGSNPHSNKWKFDKYGILQDKQGDNRLTHLQNGLYSVKVSQNAFALACTTA